MDDLIKRSDVWNITAILHSEFITIEQEQILERIDEMVDGLPSADRPQGEWIPCSERLPSEQGHYLVTFPLCNGEPWVYILSFNKGKFYETDDEWGDVEYDDVTAWMPLPKPWKGADDDFCSYGEREGE